MRVLYWIVDTHAQSGVASSESGSLNTENRVLLNGAAAHSAPCYTEGECEWRSACTELGKANRRGGKVCSEHSA